MAAAATTAATTAPTATAAAAAAAAAEIPAAAETSATIAVAAAAAASAAATAAAPASAAAASAAATTAAMLLGLGTRLRGPRNNVSESESANCVCGAWVLFLYLLNVGFSAVYVASSIFVPVGNVTTWHQHCSSQGGTASFHRHSIPC